MKYLTKGEQELYFTLERMDKVVVTMNDILDIVKDKKKAYYYVSDMTRKGILQKIKNNLYVRREPFSMVEKHYRVDSFILASKIVKEYFLSFATAMQLHGLTQRWSRIYYFSTLKFVRPVIYFDVEVKPVRIKKEKFFGFEEKKVKDENIFVSDLERTVVDMFLKPGYCGGLEDVVSSLKDLENMEEKVDFKKLLNYIERIRNKSLYNKIGYLFEDLMKKSFLDVSDDFLKKCRGKASKVVCYLSKDKDTMFVKEWNLVVSKRLVIEDDV